jgi:L-ascorbate metabolism protein UlaG (beta-lactamase superfamily)
VRVRWYGQSTFLLEAGSSVFIDPFGDMSGLAARGIGWDYPPIPRTSADVLIVTHEHGDHNAVEVVDAPVTFRSTAGTSDSPIGEVVGIASEHDDVAGTQRGANTIYRFTLGGLVWAHLGDFGQPALRPEQRAALGQVDIAIVPIGGGPTIGGERAAAVVRDLAPRLVIPMHYRTPAISFLEEPDAFLAALGARVERLEANEAEVEPLLGTREAPVVALLAPPARAKLEE